MFISTSATRESAWIGQCVYVHCVPFETLSKNLQKKDIANIDTRW